MFSFEFTAGTLLSDDLQPMLYQVDRVDCQGGKKSARGTSPIDVSLSYIRQFAGRLG